MCSEVGYMQSGVWLIRIQSDVNKTQFSQSILIAIECCVFCDWFNSLINNDESLTVFNEKVKMGNSLLQFYFGGPQLLFHIKNLGNICMGMVGNTATNI